MEFHVVMFLKYTVAYVPVFLTFPVSYMAEMAGLEPATNRLTADCSTAELSRNNICGKNEFWRPVPELNRCTRICSPLHEPLCQPANSNYLQLIRCLYIYSFFCARQEKFLYFLHRGVIFLKYIQKSRF